MADNVEVLPPQNKGDIDIEKLQALVAEAGKTYLEAQRTAEDHSTKRMQLQISHQFKITLLTTLVVAMTIGIAGLFGYLFITQGKYDFVERIVVLLVGLAIGFVSGRQTAR